MVIDGSSRLKYYCAVAVGLTLIEMLGLYLSRHSLLAGWEVTFFFYFLFGVLACALDAWRIRSAVSLRLRWALLLIATLINLLGLMWRSVIFYKILTHGATQTTATNYTDLLLALASAPLLILLSLPNGKPYARSFFWIDCVQMVFLTYLVYLKLFGVIPFTQQAVHPMPPHTLAVFTLVYSLATIGMTGLRYVGALTADERRFYGVSSLASVISFAAITLHNMLGGTSDSATYYEILPAISAYIGAGLTLSLPLESKQGAAIDRPGTMAEIVNIVCPGFFTLALLAMGIDAARHYFLFGIGAITVAFSLHMLRSTILQKIYEHSQRALQSARDELETLSLTDGLTRVANRRCFDLTLEAEWNRLARSQEPLSLMMMDIDYFKRLNDRYGHQAGDHCLTCVAKALRECTPRSGDLLARYGGEEFAVILPTTDTTGALQLAAKIQEAIRCLCIDNESPIGPYATVSIGIATRWCADTDCTPHHLLEAADKALYRAKENGRNRVETAGSPASCSRENPVMKVSLLRAGGQVK